MKIRSNCSRKSHGTRSDQSVSTSGRVGSPGTAMMKPSSDITFIHGDNIDNTTQGDNGVKKRKKRQSAAALDKIGRGLRQFSLKVCEKVESKGRTTYNEVADELVAEFSVPINTGESSDQKQDDEKNIRRRVYDALNVLMAMDIISKDKKKIQWKGLPRTIEELKKQDDEKNIRRRVYDALNVLMAMDIISKDKKRIQWKGLPRTIEELKTEYVAYRDRINKKALYQQELEKHYVGLQNLIWRNEQLYSSENVPSSAIALPFIFVETQPHAIVEVGMSEDMQLVHFDFNSTPFEFHDDYMVLKTMKLCERQTQLQVSPLAGDTSEQERSSMSEH